MTQFHTLYVCIYTATREVKIHIIYICKDYAGFSYFAENSKFDTTRVVHGVNI